MKKPDLIDNYQNFSGEFMGCWKIAKPLEYWGFYRFYHAWLVLIGKATAVTFFEDICSIVKDEKCLKKECVCFNDFTVRCKFEHYFYKEQK